MQNNLCYWLGEQNWPVLVSSKLEVRVKIQEAVLLSMSWLLWVDCYSCFVPRTGYCRACGSEVCFYRRSGHFCLYIQSLSSVCDKRNNTNRP